MFRSEDPSSSQQSDRFSDNNFSRLNPPNMSRKAFFIRRIEALVST